VVRNRCPAYRDFHFTETLRLVLPERFALWSLWQHCGRSPRWRSRGLHQLCSIPLAGPPPHIDESSGTLICSAPRWRRPFALEEGFCGRPQWPICPGLAVDRLLVLVNAGAAVIRRPSARVLVVSKYFSLLYSIWFVSST